MSNTGEPERWIETLERTITKDDFTNMREYKYKPDEEQIKFFIDLWLTEGVPYGLKPYIYQEIRVKIANKLSLHPKDISLIGSARTGFSYIKEFKDFDPNTSDLDLFLVSQNYFEKIEAEAKKYTETSPKPKNELDVKRQINKGFIDSWFISTRPTKEYPTVHKVTLAMEEVNKWLKGRYKGQYDELKIHKNTQGVGIRIYKSWDKVINQNYINLSEWLKKIKAT